MIEAVIFDLDGVITSTAGYHFNAWKLMAQKIGINIDNNGEIKLRGVNRQQCLNMILSAYHIDKTEEEKKALADYKNKIYLELISKMTQADILPHIKQLLNELKTAQIHLALASVSQNAPTILKSIQLDTMFEYIVPIATINHPKPAPDIFLDAAKHLNVPCNKAVVIDDSPIGIEAACNGMLHNIGVGVDGEYSVENTSALTIDLIQSIK